MKTMDKAMLWGAWIVIAATVSFAIWKTEQQPRVHPGIVKLEQEYQKLWNGPAGPTPQVPVFRRPDVLVGKPQPASDWSAFIAPKLSICTLPPPDVTVFVLSLPVPGQALSTLDGTTISWILTQPEVDLKPGMKRKDAKPTGFMVKRQDEEGNVDEFRVGPKETSYVDLTARPRTTYRYWVEATGSESDLTAKPPVLRPVVKRLDFSTTTRTPAATRLKLVGGDKANAVLRAETYDKAQKKWVGKTLMSAPGQKVNGWTLRGLRFDNFTLVADVTDDEGVDRVLTTKD